MTADTPPPRGTRRRWAAVVVVILFILVYVGVLFLYAGSTRDASDPEQLESATLAEGDIIVQVTPNGVRPQEGVITADLAVYPPAKYVDENTGAITEAIDIAMWPVVGGTVHFEKGTTVLASQILIRPSSTYENYPFDDYTTPLGTLAYAVAEDGTRTLLPTLLFAVSDAPGWRGVVTPLGAYDYTPSADGAAVTISMRRAGSTITIVLMLLFALVVLAVAGLLVARAVITRRRRIEATMASWFAALLFAVIPLRTNMPGSPPMGVWIDFVVVLWVEIALMVALAVFIASWLRFTKPPE